ncbi:hypothetical protein [Nostoc sp. ATCC 53789]|uniref:hypothetical protein n=1 Tax=Nostoc sp. ATCC 53789 TaxID=76335 RepID=UPI000DED28A6|nr:hypothetical protein [Nostoc sp. ATCC 53789]RCJ16916.1 hypothetical protein A6V25_29985 [Nostoc sp. ATCC 53789]
MDILQSLRTWCDRSQHKVAGIKEYGQRNVSLTCLIAKLVKGFLNYNLEGRHRETFERQYWVSLLRGRGFFDSKLDDGIMAIF